MYNSLKTSYILFLLLTINYLAFGQDNQDYTLHLEKGTLIKDNTNAYRIIPVTLYNNTKDTLRYLSMSCSWKEFYFIKDDKTPLNPGNCDKNIPIVKTIPPMSSGERVLLQFTISKDITVYKPKFRVGFNLFKIMNNENFIDVYRNAESSESKNIIWSNPLPFNLEQ